MTCASWVYAQSTLLPMAYRRNHVFDPVRDRLYITTDFGEVFRYDLAANSFLPTWAIGNQFQGLDITPDASSIYVAEGAIINGLGMFRKIDLDTGSVTNITYTPVGNERGAWDIRIGANGIGLASTRSGSGFVPFRELNTNTDTLSIRGDTPGTGPNNTVRINTNIERSADRSQFIIRESQDGSGPVFGYDALTGQFTNPLLTGGNVLNADLSVNRNGTMFAIEQNQSVSIFNKDFQLITTLGNNDDRGGGLIFDPIRDVLYVADPFADDLLALDTNTWSEIHRWSIGEDIFGSAENNPGEMSISDDGTILAMSTPSGIRLFEVPEPSSITLVVAGVLLGSRRRRPSHDLSQPQVI